MAEREAILAGHHRDMSDIKDIIFTMQVCGARVCVCMSVRVWLRVCGNVLLSAAGPAPRHRK
jgi:hypothetical protein